MINNEELYQKLFAAFQIESQENLAGMVSALLALEKSTPQQSQLWVEKIFRQAHSLKGAARAVNRSGVESICQALENVFAAMKREELLVTPVLFDVLHCAFDDLTALLGAAEERPGMVAATVKQLAAVLSGASAEAGPAPQALPTPCPPSDHDDLDGDNHEIADANSDAIVLDAAVSKLSPPEDSDESVRVPLRRLLSLLHKAEEMLTWKTAMAEVRLQLSEIVGDIEQCQKKWAAITPEIKKNKNPRWQQFCAEERELLTALMQKVGGLHRHAQYDQFLITAMVDDLRHDLKQALMFPLASILNLAPKMVRELCRRQNKQARLTITGAEIEMDRRLLEELKDPLIHLLRNCIDHGIETSEQRQRDHKPAWGEIRINISQSRADKITMEISDDGAGIDIDQLKTKAIAAGCLERRQAQQLSSEAALALVFNSGISTSAIITEISGRGLGLAIVKEKIERLAGTVTVRSQPGQGTTFRLSLPVTLAVFRGVLLRCGNQDFVIATTAVERILRIQPHQVQTIKGGRALLRENEPPLALIELASLLGITAKDADESKFWPIVIINFRGRRLALLVDTIIDEQEILVKDLGRQLRRVTNISGTTVIAPGRMALVLNVEDLLNNAMARIAAGQALGSRQSSSKKNATILVVEDSITSRMLIANLLQAAGYRVKTAVDGAAALELLQRERFDLLVSDVDMPRLNGFALTEKLRRQSQTAELPVILLTALESPRDRERGIEVGADAYLVKSGFEQGDLLDVIKRLL